MESVCLTEKVTALSYDSAVLCLFGFPGSPCYAVRLKRAEGALSWRQ